MPDDYWTDEEVARRNAEVLGTPVVPVTDAPDVPEALIQEECCKFLEEDSWRILRTDPVSDRSKGRGFGEIGMGDTLAMRPLGHDLYKTACEVLWIEWKTGKRKAGSHQLAWHAKERARGFTTWIANTDFPATIEGFRQHYVDANLMRRKRWW
jgi:hypothetical protein